MKKLRKATFAATLAASVAMVANGFGSGVAAAKSGPVNGGTVTIGQAFDFVDAFQPNMQNDAYSAQIEATAFDPLLNVDSHFNFIPWLAKSWKWSSDHKTLTMTLQPNANWSDGKPISSDDVLYTMDFLANPDYTNVLQMSNAYFVQSVKGYDDIQKGKAKSFAATGGFTKINNKTFQVHLSQVDAAILWSSIANIIPMPAHALKGIAVKDYMTAAEDKMPTVVSGPYKFVRVNGTDSVEMTANAKYWKGRPHIDNVIYKTVAADVAPGLLANGGIDVSLSGLKLTDVSKLRQIPSINVKTNPSIVYYYLGEKLYLPEFKDYRVREAFEYGINRQAMVKGILKGYGALINGPIPDLSWAIATPKDGMNPYPFNPAKAGQLLDAAGWTKGSDGWRIDPVTGKRADLHLLYPIDPIREAVAVAIQQNLAGIGVKVTLDTPLDLQAFYKKVENDDKSIQMWVAAWQLAVDPDPRGMWQDTDAYNYYRWKDAKNMKLIADTYSIKAFDQQYRKKALIKWEVYVNQQMPSNFLFQKDNVFAVNNRVHIPDSDWNPNGPFNIQDWWVSK